MKVLVVGSGGREHTFAWKLAQSSRVEKLYCVPGNAGMAQLADCRTFDLSGDFSELIDFAVSEGIDLTIIGPEAPLAAGIVDRFSESGLKVCGPDQKAAQLESSKSFTKRLMEKYGVPTAKAAVCNTPEEARSALKDFDIPVVVKADGLAAGKGVLICESLEEADDAIHTVMEERAFGDAGNQVLIEEFLVGEEASFMALTDGEHILPLVTSQDHKRALDGDQGPNTGGMGAYSPAPVVTAELHEQIMDQVIRPVVAGMKAEGCPYTGIVYAGLMFTDNGFKVLEFNCRLGDPEAQVILPRLESDLLPALEACVDGTLDQIKLEWTDKAAVCVVMASGGYPQKYPTGYEIQGTADAEVLGDVVVFHAGTARQDEAVVTSGGRVLGVTALGDSVRSAIDLAYRAVECIDFRDAHFRHDIGYRALERDV